MKRKDIYIGLLFSAFFFTNLYTQQNEFPILKGPYLGQKPPGMTPEVFAPGIISTEASEGSSSFSPDGQLFLFTRGRSELPGILMMEQIDGVWTQPRLAPFSAGRHDWDFMLAPDGKTVFVASARPLRNGESTTRDHQIWTSERKGENWSEPELLPSPVYSGQHDSYPSPAGNGTLYFFSNRDGGMGEGDIYRSPIQNGQYKIVENLGAPVNGKYHEVDPYIAPDESYLIFCSDKPGGFGKADIYITFREKDGSWTSPKNMGSKVNTTYQEYIPYVTPDGKYFFFTTNKSGNRDIYWVDAKIIRRLINENQ